MIEIDPSSPVPLYRQISARIRRLIAIGALRPGDRLPTVREMAASVRVNRNTAARAIQQLEMEGLVSTRVGKGTFVSDEAASSGRAELERQIDSHIDELLVEARSSGMSIDELQARFERKASDFALNPEEER